MPYNFAADSFHTKKLCSRLSSSEVRFFTQIGGFAFLRPPFVRRSSYHWKARSGLPISVNWTCFARCYGWGAASDYRLKIGEFAPTGTVDPKFQVEGVAPTNHSSQKTWLNDLSYGMDRSFFRMFDRWTDSFRVTSLCWHSMQRSKNVASIDRNTVGCCTHTRINYASGLRCCLCVDVM